jgi:hypothetical protein
MKINGNDMDALTVEIEHKSNSSIKTRWKKVENSLVEKETKR